MVLHDRAWNIGIVQFKMPRRLYFPREGEAARVYLQVPPPPTLLGRRGQLGPKHTKKETFSYSNSTKHKNFMIPFLVQPNLHPFLHP